MVRTIVVTFQFAENHWFTGGYGFLKKALRVHGFKAWFQREFRKSGEFREKV